ncbi:MAG: metal ABC transporter permease [Candidatus Dependentiae bacterium]|nr:metal ABC transporter permease [Candidatus Dependentiae bacterium]
MTLFQVYILCIAILVSCAATLPGVFLVLRGVALMSDAISHALLPGIIIMFLLVHRLDSPLLLIGATLAGMLTVVCTELLINTNRVKKDTAIGLVFPLFFAGGVILIHVYARNIHIDTDMVLLGEIAFAPFNRLCIGGHDCGPYALWLLTCIVIANSLFIGLCYKELKMVAFDQESAQVLGVNPSFFHYTLMLLTSITVVGAFDIVGSIVVVALTITPAATAYLLTDTLEHMISMSLVVACTSAISGYTWAYISDISIAGAIATMSGVFFVGVLLCAPHKGIYSRMRAHKKARQKILAGLESESDAP